MRPAEDASNTVNAAGRAPSARCTAARAAPPPPAPARYRAAPHTTHYTTCEHRQNTAPWFSPDQARVVNMHRSIILVSKALHTFAEQHVKMPSLLEICSLSFRIVYRGMKLVGIDQNFHFHMLHFNILFDIHVMTVIRMIKEELIL